MSWPTLPAPAIAPPPAAPTIGPKAEAAPQPAAKPEPALLSPAAEKPARPPRPSALKAEGASASTNSRSQVLAAKLTLRNVSGETLQAFIGTEPAANDDVGNAYTATSLSGPEVKEISVCWSGSRCLTDDWEKTERRATTIAPDSVVVLNIAFCCKISGTALPSKASADVQIQVRESSDGESFGPWRSVSVGVPEFAVTGKK